MKRIILIIILILIYLPIKSFGQNVVEEKSVEQLIEEISASSDQELDYTTLFDDLNYYAQNPLNLNAATREDLEKFQFLNDFQIEGILDYQKKAGEMQTIYELQFVDGFSREDIDRILPFVSVTPLNQVQLPNFKKALKFGSNTLFLRTQFITQQQKGYSAADSATLAANPNARYLGNRMRYYTRYQFQYKNSLSFGFTGEKDPGEQFFKGTQKQGFDFYSAYLQVNNIWKFKTVVLGDFQAGFGQGLVLWSGLTAGKSSYVMNIDKQAGGLRKYSSVDENRFLRGSGATIRLGNIDITGFFSQKKIDGNITMPDTSGTDNFDNPTASSFEITGLHATPSEMADRKTIHETIYGGNLNWNLKDIKIGGTFVGTSFGVNLQKNLKPYSLYTFQGNDNQAYSVDYKSYFQNFNFFGEEAMSENGGFALLNGATIALAPQISFAAIHRYYSRDYQSLYAQGFSASGYTANETGTYLGAEIHPYQSITVSTYYDIFKFPWLRYGVNAPSGGNDFFVQMDLEALHNLSISVRFRQTSKPENSSLTAEGIAPLESVTKKQIRFQVNYGLSQKLTFKNRIEFCYYKKQDAPMEKGFLMFQDVSYKPTKLPMNLDFRYELFDAQYDARIYAYETDVLYGYSIPGFSGRGMRTYLTLQYTLYKNVDLWFRYALYHYTDRTVISSGLNEIQGPNSSEIKIQLRIKF
jgi:hypothetical protein